MPYKVYHENGKYCVRKHVGGKRGDLIPGGCHDTPEEARKHQAALYVSENKEFDPLDAIIVEEEGDDDSENKDITAPSLPAGIATSFAELEAQRDYSERMQDMNELMGDFQMLVGNIIYTPESLLEEDKVKALSEVFDEFKSRVDEAMNAPTEGGEDKESAFKEVWTTEYVNNLPDSSFLYVEPGGKKDGEGRTVPRSLRHLPVKDANGKPDSAHIRNAAARANQVKLKSGGTISAALANRLIAKARGMLKRVKKEEPTVVESIISSIKELLGITEKEVEENNLTIWKEEDGSYSWLTTYSNKFLDNDNPPDILSSASHQKFVEKIDKGEAPLPEAWFWHVPEWKFGYATAVAYDDSGFPVAIGKVDDDCKEFAEWMSTQKDLGVSHGMWKRSIKRDPEDESVITEYETYEISPLPRSRAANKLADFVLLSKEKEDNMSIPVEKREELLKRGLPESVLSALEERNKANAEKANEEGIKSKEETVETTSETQPVPETKEEQTPTAETPAENKPEETPPVDVSQFPTREEVAEAIASVVAPMINEIKETVLALENQVKELTVSEEARLKEMISTTPRDSLATLMAQRLVPRSSKETSTVLPKGDDLLKFKPKETKAERAGTGIRFIDSLTAPKEE